MHQHVKANFFLPFDPFVDLLSQELIIVFLRKLTLAEGQALGPNFLGLREGTDGCRRQGRQFEGFLLDGFAFCEGRQASVVGIGQSSDTSCQFSIFTDTLCRKEFLVGNQDFCSATIADGIQVPDLIQLFHRKGKVLEDGFFKVFIGCGERYMQQGAGAGQHKLFNRNLLQNSQALFIIVAPDILTVDNPGIEGLVGRKARLDQLQGFLAFDKVQTDSVYRQFD